MSNSILIEEGVLERLDTLILLQAQLAVSNLGSQKEKVLFLDRIGLSPKVIGEVLNTTANSVSVTLSTERKKQKKS